MKINGTLEEIRALTTAPESRAWTVEETVSAFTRLLYSPAVPWGEKRGLLVASARILFAIRPADAPSDDETGEPSAAARYGLIFPELPVRRLAWGARIEGAKPLAPANSFHSAIH